MKFERDSRQSPACSSQWYLVKRNREERWRHRAAGESLQRTSENQARVYQSRVPISTRSLSYLPTFDIRGPPYGSDAFSSFVWSWLGVPYVANPLFIFLAFSPYEFNIRACRSNFLRVSVLSRISSPGNFTRQFLRDFFTFLSFPPFLRRGGLQGTLSLLDNVTRKYYIGWKIWGFKVPTYLVLYKIVVKGCRKLFRRI